MKPWHPLIDGLSLHVPERVSEADALRQKETARCILARLAERPGLVLADEVGMGKTFVALAVAASVALSRGRRPVVVMVPSSLKEKWPRDFGVFRDHCLPEPLRQKMQCASAETGVQFLKLLDNAVRSRPSLIFLTHGAMSRSLTDGWVRLAIIQRALHRRKDARLRQAVCGCAASLVEVGSRTSRHRGLCSALLGSPAATWRQVMERHGYEREGVDDDPVPTAVIRALRDFNTDDLYAALDDYIPRNESPKYYERLTKARSATRAAVKDLWKVCLRKLRLKLPLLILDEAHHLKNDQTDLAGLFASQDAVDDAEQITRGPLAGVFERMLFLTATPFQLGHHELCSVLDRFNRVSWKSAKPPKFGRDECRQQLSALRTNLDTARESAVALDGSWGFLTSADLLLKGSPTINVDEWWSSRLSNRAEASGAVALVLGSFDRAKKHMGEAEKLLQPWVIRHLKPRTLPEPWSGKLRRIRVTGRGILDDIVGDGTPGIPVSGDALLPFLLAARAAQCAPESRPLFAEGLASSYEAFRHTRKQSAAALDQDAGQIAPVAVADSARWYLEQLDRFLPLAEAGMSSSHPKVRATVDRVIAAWRQGEKVLVFCHFVRTGRTLRRAISEALSNAIRDEAVRKLGCSPKKARGILGRLGNRFDRDSPAGRACDKLTEEALRNYPGLSSHRDKLLIVVRRFLRTPSFLVRFFPLSGEVLDEATVEAAFHHPDDSGSDLGKMLRNFFDFLERRQSADERKRLIIAVEKMQTGGIASVTADEYQGDDHSTILPNVRLVNGATKSETRQRLMLTFNSPFFPEVLIASSVMAEGVDLHLYCRYVIHHDLDWNPSMIEQRTGRVDRIGAKVERTGQPIRVYLPYVAETQDEKMYRVVSDRERWFCVVMGEKFAVDTRHTDELAERIPFPAAAAHELAFRLEVAGAATTLGTQSP